MPVTVPIGSLVTPGGEQGPEGKPGPAGGPPGPQGDKGDKGDQGEKGDKGDTGDTGADSTVPGPQGDKGDKGDKGDTGDKGDKGDVGATGQPGMDGNAVGTISIWSTSVPPNGYLNCDGSEQLITDYPELYDILGEIYGVASDPSLFKLPDFRSRTAIGQGQGPGGLTDRVIGVRGGEETNVLTVAEMPPHSHPVSVSDPTHFHGADHYHGIDGGQFSHQHPTYDPTHLHSACQPIRYGNWQPPAGAFQMLFTLNNGDWQYWTGGTNVAGTGVVANWATLPAGGTNWASVASAAWVNTGAKGTGIGATSAVVGGGAAHNNMSPFLVINYVIRALPGLPAGGELQTLRDEVEKLRKLLYEHIYNNL